VLHKRHPFESYNIVVNGIVGGKNTQSVASFAYPIHNTHFLAHCALAVNLLKIGIALMLVSLYLSTFI